MSPEKLQQKKEYKAQFEDIVDQAKELVLTGEYYVPKVVFETNHRIFLNQVDPLPDNWRAFMRKLGASAASQGNGYNLDQIFLICDGWVDRESLWEEGEDPLAAETWPKEVLIVSGLRIDEKKEYMRLFEMVRDIDEKVIALPEVVLPEGENVTRELPLLQAFCRGFAKELRAIKN
jgi:hypothetical protein